MNPVFHYSGTRGPGLGRATTVGNRDPSAISSEIYLFSERTEMAELLRLTRWYLLHNSLAYEFCHRLACTDCQRISSK